MSLKKTLEIDSFLKYETYAPDVYDTLSNQGGSPPFRTVNPYPDSPFAQKELSSYLPGAEFPIGVSVLPLSSSRLAQAFEDVFNGFESGTGSGTASTHVVAISSFFDNRFRVGGGLGNGAGEVRTWLLDSQTFQTIAVSRSALVTDAPLIVTPYAPAPNITDPSGLLIEAVDSAITPDVPSGLVNQLRLYGFNYDRWYSLRKFNDGTFLYQFAQNTMPSQAPNHSSFGVPALDTAQYGVATDLVAGLIFQQRIYQNASLGVQSPGPALAAEVDIRYLSNGSLLRVIYFPQVPLFLQATTDRKLIAVSANGYVMRCDYNGVFDFLGYEDELIPGVGQGTSVRAGTSGTFTNRRGLCWDNYSRRLLYVEAFPDDAVTFENRWKLKAFDLVQLPTKVYGPFLTRIGVNDEVNALACYVKGEIGEPIAGIPATVTAQLASQSVSVQTSSFGNGLVLVPYVPDGTGTGSGTISIPDPE